MGSDGSSSPSPAPRGRGEEEEGVELTEEQKETIQRNMERAKRIRYLRSQPAQAEEPAAAPASAGLNPLRGGFLHPHREQAKDATGTAPRMVEPDPTIVYPLDRNEKCTHCGSIELDFDLKRNFNINICESCCELHSEGYRLITKTTAKEDYLLTEEELNDKGELPHITKPNPYKSSWSDMHLYLTCHIRDFAVKKWGSMEALDEELARRAQLKETRKEKKYKEKLSDLRRKTRSAAIKKAITTSSKHIHVFGEAQDGHHKQCTTCGLVIEEEEI